MAGTLTLVGSGSGTTSVTLPAHQIGDLIVLFVTRTGSTTAPTKPTATGTVPNWVTRGTTTGTTAYIGLWSFVATATTTSTGTWTSATEILAVVYRGTGQPFVYGTATFGTGTGTTVTYPAATNAVTTHTALWLNFGFTKAVNSSLETPPTGSTLIVNSVAGTSSECSIFSKAGGANYTATGVSVGGTSNVWIAVTWNLSLGNWASQTIVSRPTTGSLAAASPDGYLNSDTGANGTKTYTLGQQTGWQPASANRWVGVVGQMTNAGFTANYEVTAATIGGVTASIVWTTGGAWASGAYFCIYANVPTGTTASAVFTAGTGSVQVDLLCEFCMDNITGSSLTVKISGTDAGTGTSTPSTFSPAANDQIFAFTIYASPTAQEDSPFGKTSTLTPNIEFYDTANNWFGSAGSQLFPKSASSLTYIPATNYTKATNPIYSVVVQASTATAYPTPWTPSSLATSPVEWFSGDSGVTSSAGVISAVAQRGTNSGGMIASGTGPSTSTQNGIGSMTFNGSSTGLITSSTRNYASGVQCLFAVAKRTTGRTGYDVIVNTDAPWTSTTGAGMQYGSSGTTDGPDIEVFGGSGYDWGNYPNAETLTAPGATDGKWHMIDSQTSSASGINTDGSAATLSKQGNTAFPGMTGYKLDIGFNPDGNWFSGDIAEIIVLDYAPTTGELAQIQGYLAWKWGTPGLDIGNLVERLPLAHTYKQAPPAVTGGTGAASILEADDSVSATAQIKVQASAAITEASDTIGASSAVLISANASVTESADTVVGTGTLPGVSGTASITEDGDTVSSTGALLISATASNTEGGDTTSSTATVLVTANSSITEAGDTVSASGIGPANHANVSVTEADDTVVSASKIAIAATASITEGDDSSTSAAAILIKGTVANTEQGDTAAGTATVLIQATSAITEAADTISATGVGLRFGTANITEGDDGLVSVGGGTQVVNATGSAMTMSSGTVTLKYGWVEFAVGSWMTMIAGHLDSISWVPEVPGTGNWTPVTTPNATWTPIVPGTATWKPVDA